MSVSKVSVAIKRLLLDSLFAATSSTTLLPKRIALPVFASDAVSSVAYAPQEIFLVLSVAGVGALTFTPWVAVAVAVVMVVVVASYGECTPAHRAAAATLRWANVNLGANAGSLSAVRCSSTMSLVSIASAAENIGSAFPFVHEHRCVQRRRDRRC